MYDHLSEEAKAFADRVQALPVPEGETKQHLLRTQRIIPPMLALVEFIRQHHTIEDNVNSEKLLRHVNLATGMPRGIGSAKKNRPNVVRAIREAVECSEESLFDLLEKMTKHIRDERWRSYTDELIGAKLEKVKPGSDAHLPPLSDVNLSEEERIIHEEAEELYPTYKDSIDPLDRFHRRKGKADIQSHQHETAVKEAERYMELAKSIRQTYDDTVGHSIPVSHRRR